MSYSFKTISTLALLLIIALNSCSEQPKAKEENKIPSVETTEQVSIPKETMLKPIPAKYQDMVKADKFTMEVAKGFSGTTRKGMKVEIPANALVDEENNPVKGEVELEVKEYYSPSEIIVSNIPMQYMDGDELKHFQSDGMFTITASQKGKELKVAGGKQLKLTTKRKKEGVGYEFYALEDNKWVKDKANEVSEVPVSDKRIPVLRKPKEPIAYYLVKFNPNYYTVEKDQRNALPEHHVDTRAKGFYDENTVKQITIDVRQNPWILNKKKWKFMKHERYILKKDDLVQTDFDTVSYSIQYAIRGNKKYNELKEKQEAEKVKYERELAAYTENLNARMAAGQLTMAERTQELVVNQFGTFNIDRFLSLPPKLLVEKNYDISIPKSIDPSDRVFLVVKGGDETLIPVDLAIYAPLVRFNKKEKNALIVMAEDKVYAINKEDFEAMAKAQIRQEKFDFQLKDELIFTSTEEFNEQLENLF